MNSSIDNCLEASLLITRAAGARSAASQSLKQMRRDPSSLGWLRRYVIASAQVENAELELIKIKKELTK